MKKTKTDQPVVGKLSEKKDEEFIKTGITELDEVLGGVGRGRITELWGAEGVGKTHLATLLMANLSKDQKVLYVDSEFALNKVRVAELGADTANVAYIADSRLERVCELLVDSVGKYDVIILDSLALLTPMTVANAEVGERSIGLFALLLKHWILKFRPALVGSKTAFIALNQYRPSINMYQAEQPPGGLVWRHSCDVRIKLSRNSSDTITEGKEIVGHWVHCTIKKNRLGRPGLEFKTKILY